MTLRKKAGADKQNQQIQKLEKKLEETQRELKAAELINKELEQIYKDGLVSKFQIPKQKNRVASGRNPFIGSRSEIPTGQAWTPTLGPRLSATWTNSDRGN